MFFISIKEINRLLNKGMSYIYRKVTKLTFSKLRSSKSSSPGQFSNFLLQLKNEKSRSKTVCGFSIILILNYDVLKSKSPCLYLNKNINLIKTRRNRKWKIAGTISERWNLRLSSYKNRKLKVKVWWVGSRERKKSSFSLMFILY